jgi:hypothetical protein
MALRPHYDTDRIAAITLRPKRQQAGTGAPHPAAKDAMFTEIYAKNGGPESAVFLGREENR